MKRNGEEQRRRMLEEPIPRVVARLALPTTISQLVTIIYNTADTYFVSQIGTSAAAAVGVVFSLMSIIQAVGFGLGMGASALVSRQLGADRGEDANRTASSAFAAALLCGLLLTVLGLPNLTALIRNLGATPTILPYAKRYALYILLAAPLTCSSFVLNVVLRAEGEAALAMCGLCTGGILNMILDPLLIFRLNMGIAGAAIATAVSQMVSFTILFSFYLRGRSIVRLHLRYVSRNPDNYIKIVRSGIPTVFRQGMGSIASIALNTQAAAFGDSAVAAMTIANKVYVLVRNMVIGIGQGYQPAAGYNYGAGRKDRVRQAFRFAVVVGTGVCVAAAVVLFPAAPLVMTWFRADDPEVVRMGVTALRLACLSLPGLAYSTYVNQLYQCLGFSGPATVLACCRQGIFYLPLILILPGIIGIWGIQFSQPGADILTFLVSIPCQIWFFERKLQLNETKQREEALSCSGLR